MSKPLSSYPPSEVRKVADRRILANTKGLGYWASVDYLKNRKDAASWVLKIPS